MGVECRVREGVAQIPPVTYSDRPVCLLKPEALAKVILGPRNLRLRFRLHRCRRKGRGVKRFPGSSNASVAKRVGRIGNPSYKEILCNAGGNSLARNFPEHDVLAIRSSFLALALCHGRFAQPAS